jgi:hypothetical protein
LPPRVAQRERRRGGEGVPRPSSRDRKKFLRYTIPLNGKKERMHIGPTEHPVHTGPTITLGLSARWGTRGESTTAQPTDGMTSGETNGTASQHGSLARTELPTTTSKPTDGMTSGETMAARLPCSDCQRRQAIVSLSSLLSFTQNSHCISSLWFWSRADGNWYLLSPRHSSLSRQVVSVVTILNEAGWYSLYKSKAGYYLFIYDSKTCMIQGELDY